MEEIHSAAGESFEFLYKNPLENAISCGTKPKIFHVRSSKSGHFRSLQSLDSGEVEDHVLQSQYLSVSALIAGYFGDLHFDATQQKHNVM